MDTVEPVPEDEVQERAQLLPEETAAGGSDDRSAQAKAILDESEERVNAPHDPPDGETEPESEPHPTV